MKQILTDSIKAKRIRYYVLKCNCTGFLDIAKFAVFRLKNTDVNRSQGVCHVTHIFFGSS